MCGITACSGRGDAVRKLLDGLESLEYRGYDSAGVAVRNGNGLTVHKRSGEISALKEEIERSSPEGRMAIGHTRWSTHGRPTDANAHPHTDCTGRVAVVHNGIVENHRALGERLREAGHAFESETDTEVVPHLVEEELETAPSVESAVRRAVDRLEGSYAIAAIVDGHDAIYATRSGSPLVIGVGGHEHFLASDVPAFLEHTDRVVYLEDGDFVSVDADGYQVTAVDGTPVSRPVETVEWDPRDAEKGEHDHYMAKEIAEQPTALAQTIRGRVDDGSVRLESFPPGAFEDVRSIQFVACGTSYHAAQYGALLLRNRGADVSAFRAGEYTTTPAPVDEQTLVVGVTQSGETADTLESLRSAGNRGARTLAMTNVVGSTAARECDDALFIRAGPEISVAATKTFSSQVAALVLLAGRLVDEGVVEGAGDEDELLASLSSLPADVRRVLGDDGVSDVVDAYGDRPAYFFIGRGIVHPVAMEGALKLKEITYEHAEGFAAGQLKHGPLAMVTEDTPVFTVLSGRHDEKTIGNAEEVKARGAPVVAVARGATPDVTEVADHVLEIPETHPALAGVLANVQLQRLAYRLADRYDRSIDKPRNLAKSVTVE